MHSHQDLNVNNNKRISVPMMVHFKSLKTPKERLDFITQMILLQTYAQGNLTPLENDTVPELVKEFIAPTSLQNGELYYLPEASKENIKYFIRTMMQNNIDVGKRFRGLKTIHTGENSEAIAAYVTLSSSLGEKGACYNVIWNQIQPGVFEFNNELRTQNEDFDWNQQLNSWMDVEQQSLFAGNSNENNEIKEDHDNGVTIQGLNPDVLKGKDKSVVGEKKLETLENLEVARLLDGVDLSFRYNDLTNALSKFNTRRSSFFSLFQNVDAAQGKESPEHKQLREASEKLIEARAEYERSKNATFYTEEEKEALKKNLYDKANIVISLTNTYENAKHNNANTPAGGNRLEGARDLRIAAMSLANALYPEGLADEIFSEEDSKEIDEELNALGDENYVDQEEKDIEAEIKKNEEEEKQQQELLDNDEELKELQNEIDAEEKNNADNAAKENEIKAENNNKENVQQPRNANNQSRRNRTFSVESTDSFTISGQSNSVQNNLSSFAGRFIKDGLIRDIKYRYTGLLSNIETLEQNNVTGLEELKQSATKLTQLTGREDEAEITSLISDLSNKAVRLDISDPDKLNLLTAISGMQSESMNDVISIKENALERSKQLFDFNKHMSQINEPVPVQNVEEDLNFEIEYNPAALKENNNTEEKTESNPVNNNEAIDINYDSVNNNNPNVNNNDANVNNNDEIDDVLKNYKNDEDYNSNFEESIIEENANEIQENIINDNKEDEKVEDKKEEKKEEIKKEAQKEDKKVVAQKEEKKTDKNAEVKKESNKKSPKALYTEIGNALSNDNGAFSIIPFIVTITGMTDAERTNPTILKNKVNKLNDVISQYEKNNKKKDPETLKQVEKLKKLNQSVLAKVANYEMKQAQEEKHVEPVKPAKAVKTEGEIRRENNKKKLQQQKEKLTTGLQDALKTAEKKKKQAERLKKYTENVNDKAKMEEFKQKEKARQILSEFKRKQKNGEIPKDQFEKIKEKYFAKAKRELKKADPEFKKNKVNINKYM
ncbi:MAG: hypothetical protein E7301_11555 [Butyrivibrio sp.]|nr:hypothetical protein [Butyrivibrio sp.]